MNFNISSSFILSDIFSQAYNETIFQGKMQGMIFEAGNNLLARGFESQYSTGLKRQLLKKIIHKEKL